MLTEIRVPIRPGGGSAYEKVERRVGDWAVAAAGRRRLARRRHDRRRRHRPHRRRRRRTSTAPEAEDALRGQARRATTSSPRPAASPPSTASPQADQRGPADYKRHLAGELTRRALRRAPSPEPADRRPDVQVTMTVNGDEVTPRGRAAAAARALPPRRARAHRHPLGLRHVELRDVRGVDGRRAGEVAAPCSRPWPTATRSARSRASSRTASSTRCSRASSRSTGCSAASARRA